MNIEYAYSIIYNFLISHQLVSLGIVIGLVLFLWRKPKEFFKFTLFTLGLIVVFYILTLLNQSMLIGVEKKLDITTERENKLFEQ